MRKFALIAMLFLNPAIAKPKAESDNSILFMAAALVKMAQQDGVIDSKEENLLKNEFPLQERANPVAVFTLDQSNLLNSIALLNLNDRKKRGFLTFLSLVALADGKVEPAEKEMLTNAIDALLPTLTPDSLFGSAKNLQYLILHRELKLTLKNIAEAQMLRGKNGESYISATLYPATNSRVPQPWVKSDSGNFKELDWTPPSEVVGMYWIDTNENGFDAKGIIDADGDGQFATYTANQENTSPKRETDSNIQ